MRKKLLLCLLLCAALLLSLGAAAHAEPQLDYVNDYAGLLTEETRGELNERAAELYRQYGFPVYIVTVPDYRDYVSGGGIEYFAEEVFHSYTLGAGETEDGILLALSMDGRDFDLYAHGDFGNYAFTDYGKDQLADSFLDNFRRDDWAGGFADYIDNCGVMLGRAKNGDPVDQWIPDPTPQPQPQERQHGMTPFKWLMSLLFPGLAGGAAVSGMSKQMKTAVKQTRADEYVGRGSPHLNIVNDQFVNRNVTRQVIRKQNSENRPSGHYGGTTISGSHGGSHHSGKV